MRVTTRLARCAMAVAAAMVVTAVGGRPAVSAQDGTLRALNTGSSLQIFPVREHIFLLVQPGGGANITVQSGPDGMLVVDTGPGPGAGTVLSTLRKISRLPIRYVVNTSNRDDHVGGNAVINAAGQGFQGSDPSAAGPPGAGPRATSIAHENVLKRMSGLGETEAAAAGAWPNLAFFGKRKDIYFNNETVQIIHAPAAQADGDSVVFFRSSDVVSAGDVFLTTTYPVIDVARGGSIDGVIDALNALIDLTNTQKNQEGGTLVIPGHGRVSDEADVVEYRDMLTIIRGRVRHYAARGMTLEQIKQARPTVDYDGRYDTGSGPAAAERLIEVVYRSVMTTAPAAAPASRSRR